jgi:hypothetical protein
MLPGSAGTRKGTSVIQNRQLLLPKNRGNAVQDHLARLKPLGVEADDELSRGEKLSLGCDEAAEDQNLSAFAGSRAPP